MTYLLVPIGGLFDTITIGSRNLKVRAKYIWNPKEKEWVLINDKYSLKINNDLKSKIISLRTNTPKKKDEYESLHHIQLKEEKFEVIEAKFISKKTRDKLPPPT